MSVVWRQPADKASPFYQQASIAFGGYLVDEVPRYVFQRVEVGDYAEWKQHSDHRPLVVEVWLTSV